MPCKRGFVRILFALALFVAVLEPSPVAAQPTPEQTQSRSARDDLVTLRGCINGRTFVVTDASGIRDGNGEPMLGIRFRLEASRAMLEALEDHSGHEDEVTGVFDRQAVVTANDERLLVEKQVGRVRVFAGRRRTMGAERPTRRAAVPFELDSFEHLADRCPPN